MFFYIGRIVFSIIDAFSILMSLVGGSAEVQARLWKALLFMEHEPQSWGKWPPRFSGILGLRQSKGLEYLTRKKGDFAFRVI